MLILNLNRKIDRCAKNPENSSTEKLGEHIPCGYSMSTIGTFGRIKNKHTLYRRKDCIKKFYTFLREYARNITGLEKKKVLLFTKEELKSHQDAKVCCTCEKMILKMFANYKNYRKVRDHCHFTGKYRGAAHSICGLKFNVLNEIPVVFHNGQIMIIILS